jgi:3-methyladenine DNA glycosylase/8-oxoguanine DNA glycosylase
MAVTAQPGSAPRGKGAGHGAPGRVVELRVEVRPASPFRLPRMLGRDGVTRRRGGVIERLLHDVHGEPVAVRVAQTGPDAVLFGARAESRAAAEHGIARMRFALGVDDDLAPFYARFARDPLIGRSLRARPWLRVARRPEPFEALVWAICEQLIEYDRAAAIQGRIARRLGRSWDGPRTERSARAPGSGRARAGLGGVPTGRLAEEWARGLCDLPTAATLGAISPALLQSFDLAGARSLALRRAAREVAGGRVRLDGGQAPEQEHGWRRLRAIDGIGAWTVEMLALRGQGRYDQLPAGDLGLLKLAGRLLSGGDPRARAREEQVRELFAPYGEWAGLAAVHAVGGGHAASVGSPAKASIAAA